jgi:1-acyl-sn-glycerol-3-phosphate acyltransferase
VLTRCFDADAHCVIIVVTLLFRSYSGRGALPIVKAKLVSLWNWFEIVTLVILSTVLVALLFVLTVPFDRVRKVVGRFFRICGTMLVRFNPLWSVKVSGWQRPRVSGPFVVVANHQSIADIPAISYLPWEMKWVSKESNFKVPGLGWMMSMAGDVRLRRGEKESAKSAMARCKWYLDRGMSVMLFPEGTRSSDGEIRPFKDGAFRLAIEAGYPILPVAVAGTRHAIPKNSWIFGVKCQARIEVLPPIETKGLTTDDVEALKERTRGQISAAFERLGKWMPTLPRDGVIESADAVSGVEANAA